MTYYSDPNKITFGKAEEYVSQFLREQNQRAFVTSQDVAEFFDVEQTHHNLVRINDALSRMCEVHRESGSQPTRYRT